MKDKKFYVISYDIADNRKRTKASETLKDFAGARVQKSVFECYLNDSSLNKLLKSLEEIIDKDTDNVLIYNLCEACVSKKNSIGLNIIGKNEDFRIL